MRHIRYIVLGCTAVITLGAQHAPPRTPVIQSVELLVPFAPVTFTQAGGLQLVHELHITNFLSVDVTLIAVQARDANTHVLAEHRNSDLQARLSRPGLPNNHPTPQIVGAGARAVVNFWIALPPGSRPPAFVEHRLELEVHDVAGPVRTAVQGGVSAVSSRAVPTLDPPLRGGPWVAVYHPVLKGGHRTAIYTVEGRARIPGRFAIDFIALPPGGVFVRSPAVRPHDWNGFGTHVIAVAAGTIVSAVDDLDDDTPQPVAFENASGNYVAIDIGDGRFAFYEHLQRGSIAVKIGQRVRRGQIIARLGSSGSSSIGPHLHFHVADANSLLAAEGLPFVFREFTHLGGFASIDALVTGQTPSLTSAGRHVALERPGPNTILRFP